ncbi:MAG: hypothetical protein AAF311_00160 [Pseudomonadota bacterium]
MTDPAPPPFVPQPTDTPAQTRRPEQSWAPEPYRPPAPHPGQFPMTAPAHAHSQTHAQAQPFANSYPHAPHPSSGHAPAPPRFDPRNAVAQPAAAPPPYPRHASHPSTVAPTVAAPAAQPGWAEPAQAGAPHMQSDDTGPQKGGLFARLRRRGSGTSAQETTATAPKPSTGQATRKAFLLGLLSGATVVLLLGQIFRAATPVPDYSYAAPPLMAPTTPAATPAEDDPDSTGVAFLDRVEGLETPD